MTGRVIVTGASGFIGHYIVPMLVENDWGVYAIARRAAPEGFAGAEWIQADISRLREDPALQRRIEELGATHLLHLAWYTEHGKFWSAEENFLWVECSMALLQAFHRGGGRRVVVAGSCAEYDWSCGYCREDQTPCRPSSVYGVCKHSLHMLARAWAEAHDIQLCWGRIFFPYGPGEPNSKLVPYLISRILEGQQPVCRDGAAWRDFIHARDVASALACLLSGNGSGTFNICSSQPVLIRELAILIAQLLGEERGTEGNDGALPDVPLLVGDNRKLRSLGWESAVSLEEGLKEYIAYLREGRK